MARAVDSIYSMAFRFRKSFKVAPGVKLNVGKTGASLSLGVKGASVNMGKRGVTATVGIPGTGLSYSEKLGSPGPFVAPEQKSTDGPGCALAIVAGLIGFGMVGADAVTAALVFWSCCYLGWYLYKEKLKKNHAALVQAGLEARRRRLEETYGDDAANRIIAERLWIGAPMMAAVEMFGHPEATAEKVSASSTVHTLKYFENGKDRYKLKITVENGEVSGWDDSR